MLQPWNRELVVGHPKIVGFESWDEVPDLLQTLPALGEKAG